MKTVTLTRPVKRGETTIATVALREPTAGDMRGLKLSEVLLMDVSSMSRLIPRVSDPGLTPDEIADLSAVDLAVLFSQALSFFFTPEQMAAQAATLG